MKALSLTAIVLTVVAFATAPALRAETPPDQLKDAAGIPLTTELLDKMDAFLTKVSADDAAKAELNEIGKDPKMTQETWAAAVDAKCPKTAAHMKAAGITASDFSKGISAIMACAMSEDLTKSEDKAVKANAEFVVANKDRAEKIFGGFMQLSMPASP